MVLLVLCYGECVVYVKCEVVSVLCCLCSVFVLVAVVSVSFVLRIL